MKFKKRKFEKGCERAVPSATGKKMKEAKGEGTKGRKNNPNQG